MHQQTALVPAVRRQEDGCGGLVEEDQQVVVLGQVIRREPRAHGKGPDAPVADRFGEPARGSGCLVDLAQVEEGARQVGLVKRPLDAPRLGRAGVIGLQARPGATAV